MTGRRCVDARPLQDPPERPSPPDGTRQEDRPPVIRYGHGLDRRVPC